MFFVHTLYQRLSVEDEQFIKKSRTIYELNKFYRISEYKDIKYEQKTWYKNLHEKTKEKIINRLRYWTNYETNIFEIIIEIINENI